MNYLINAKIIILHGKGWKFNTTGKKEAIEDMDLLKSLRDNPDRSIEEPSSLDAAKGVSEFAKGKGDKK